VTDIIPYFGPPWARMWYNMREMEDRQSRTAALLGTEAIARLAAAQVLVVGVGGVGGWCAEALVRTGIGSITIVDDDVVAPSNLNRQCAATVAVLGQAKVEAMRERLLAVNPDCRITALNRRYPVDGLELSGFDVIGDAIDSVDCKAALILNAAEAGVPLISSMGAALRTDPTRLRMTGFDKVGGDGLARALRQRFKRLGVPPPKFDAVWSEEPPQNCEIRGSVMQVVEAFGMGMAAGIIRRITA